jgi:NitT/TauT family transport system substrate-binding protein
MSGPETATLGLGDVTDARLKKNIEIIVDANKLPKSPEPSQVFNRSLLPPAAERLKKL